VNEVAVVGEMPLQNSSVQNRVSISSNNRRSFGYSSRDSKQKYHQFKQLVDGKHEENSETKSFGQARQQAILEAITLETHPECETK
jgi:hypothetical protein